MDGDGLKWTLLFLIVASYILIILIKETYKTVFQVRAQRLGITLPQSGLKGPAVLKFIITVNLRTAILMLCTGPNVILLSLYVACNFVTVYCVCMAFLIVFTAQYGFANGWDGLPFSAVVGSCIGSAISILSDRSLY